MAVRRRCTFLSTPAASTSALVLASLSPGNHTSAATESEADAVAQSTLVLQITHTDNLLNQILLATYIRKNNATTLSANHNLNT